MVFVKLSNSNEKALIRKWAFILPKNSNMWYYSKFRYLDNKIKILL